MKKLIYTTLLALSALSVPAVHAAQVKVSASIDSAQMEMGSRAVITLDIADADRRGTLIDLPKAGAESPETGVYFVSVDADTFPAGYQYRIMVQAFEPGDIRFAPFRYVTGSDTAESDFLALKVLPVGLDSLQTINPMASVVNPPRKWFDFIPDWVWWALAGLALVAVIVAVAMLYKKNGGLIITKPKPVNPYEAAMAELSRLREKKLAESGREKEYYTTLVDILRTYLERRFGINAMEMSSTQILQSLRSNADTRDNQPMIRQILEIADFVKFANVRPMPDDNIKTFNNVVKFVEDTKPAPVEEEGENADKKSKPDKKNKK